MSLSAFSMGRLSPAAKAAARRAQRHVLKQCLDCGGERDSAFLRCRICRFLLTWRVTQSQQKARVGGSRSWR
jgi:hypothetical protein